MREIPNQARNKRVSNSRQRKQQHLLDVKLRESKERSRRIGAVAGAVFKTLFVLSLLTGIWFGGKEALRRFLWENSDYFVHLEDVRFHSDGTLTREQALTASGIKESENIFKVDLAQARAAIEKLPQVEGAEVQRLLPNHVTISITERRPVAWVTAKMEDTPSISNGSFLIDARGNVMRTRVTLPEYDHFPIVSGVQTGNLTPGQRVNTFEMQSALELVRLNADSTRFQVRNIDLAKGYCLVVTDEKHAHITFGLDHLDAQLARLNLLLDVIEPTHKEIQTVNLLVERNVPVTFYDPEGDRAAAEENALLKPEGRAKPPGSTPSKDRSASAPVAQKPATTPSQTPKKQAKSTGKMPTPSPLKNPFHFNQ